MYKAAMYKRQRVKVSEPAIDSANDLGPRSPSNNKEETVDLFVQLVNYKALLVSWLQAGGGKNPVGD